MPPLEDVPPDCPDSPFFLLAVLVAARRTKDRTLERVTRSRLNQMGVLISFGNEISTPVPPAKPTGGRS